MSTRKVLLLGGSFSAIPIFYELKKNGFSVGVCGEIISEPCHSLADYSHLINYADYENVAKIFEEFQYDYIVPSCNDIAYLTGSKIAQTFKLPGFSSPEVTSALHLKNEFRELCLSLGINIPRFINIAAGTTLEIDSLRFPVLLKPIKSFSGIGVCRIENLGEINSLPIFGEKFLTKESYVLEEYISGSLHSHSAFIDRGEINAEYFADEFCTVYPYQVNCSNSPSFLEGFIRAKVRDSMDFIIKKLKLCDGLLHTQFMVDHSNEIWIIETMRRCPGDLYPRMISESLGVNYIEMYIQPFIGKSIASDREKKPVKFIARHTISQDEKKMIQAVCLKIPGCDYTFFPLKKTGTVLHEAPYDKLGILFADFPTKVELKFYTEKFSDYVMLVE